jgi:hypothetical protein
VKSKPIPHLLTALAFGTTLGTASADLIHHWAFDEGSGIEALDSAGSSPGAIFEATWASDAIRGTYLSFDGSNDYVFPMVTLPPMTLTNTFTWAVWVNSQVLPSEGSQVNSIILGNRRDGNNTDFTPREFLKLTPTKFEWRPLDSSNNTEYPDVPCGVWVHIAVVKDGANIQTYFNGAPASSKTIVNAYTNEMPFFIGGEPGQPNGEHFNGFLDDVRLYDNALTAQEVQDLIGATPLLPYWDVKTISLNPTPADTALTDTIADSATNPGDDAMMFAKVSGPDWLSVNPDGTLGGTPLEADIGLNEFVVSATNAAGTTEVGLEVTVLDPNFVQPPLVAGWDNWTDLGSNTYDPAFTNSVTAQAVGTITSAGENSDGIGPFGNSGVDFGASTDGTWGSIFPTAGIPSPDSTDPPASSAAAVGVLRQTDGYFDFTVTADPGTTINFTSFNFDAYRRFGGSADLWALSVVSGSVTNGPIANGSVKQAASSGSTMAETDPHNWDIDLTGLEDRVLNAGESAVFRLEFTDASLTAGGGNHTMLDNVAIFGEFSSGSADLNLKVESSGDDLILTWDSQQGKLYNLLSDTDLDDPISAWPIFDGNMEIVATPPMNMLTIARPADPRRFFTIDEFNAPPMAVFEDDFESGVGSWEATSTGDAGTAWELGTPTNVGPNGANSGTNAFGTNISANYTNNANVSLKSELFDLTGAAEATLKFASYIAGDPGFDFGTVNVLDSTDALLGEVIVLGNEASTDWDDVAIALPEAALGKMVKLEFLFNSDNAFNGSGWYIDDVVVTVP